MTNVCQTTQDPGPHGCKSGIEDFLDRPEQARTTDISFLIGKCRRLGGWKMRNIEKIGTFKPDICWERYKYRLPKSKAEVEVIREIVMNDDDMEFMELSNN